MCLSIAYKNSIAPENIIAKNVMSIETLQDKIVLTDLMERKFTVQGTLQLANLTDAYIIINVKEGN